MEGVSRAVGRAGGSWTVGWGRVGVAPLQCREACRNWGPVAPRAGGGGAEDSLGAPGRVLLRWSRIQGLTGD